jgi:hypothetical protein
MEKLFSKYIVLSVVAVSLSILSGCTVRNYSVVKQRPDRVVEGNRGYISGTAPERKPGKDTRKTYIWEVEFGKHGSNTPEVIYESTEQVIVEPTEEVAAPEEEKVADEIVIDMPLK